MIWQDIIITIANLMFSYALVPQVIKGFKDKKGHLTFQTGLLTTIGLYAACIAFFSLGLFFSGLVTNFNATMWFILFIQRIIYK